MKSIYDPERHAAYCRHVRDSLTRYYCNTDLPANLQDLADRFTDLDLSKADQIMRDRILNSVLHRVSLRTCCAHCLCVLSMALPQLLSRQPSSKLFLLLP